MIQKNWQELIKPTNLEVSSEGLNKSKIVVEPLERGFGLTLGNALRRVLLSSLQGGAVTAVKIDGVLHEFSVIPGVREDVTDIVLNVKCLAVAVHSEGTKSMTLKAEGPCVVTAAMIETGHDVEIMNPDLVICNLDAGAKINMELTVNTGNASPWCTASIASGGGYIIVSYTQNNLTGSTSTRTATITISGNGGAVEDTVTLTQYGSNLSITPTTVYLDYPVNSSKPITVTSNNPWEITDIRDE